MKANKHKLPFVVSAIYLFLSIPVTVHFSEIFGDEYVMQLFSFLCIAAPVWIVWGWRWLTDNHNIPKRLLITLIIASFFVFSYIAFFWVVGLCAIDASFAGVSKKGLLKLKKMFVSTARGLKALLKYMIANKVKSALMITILIITISARNYYEDARRQKEIDDYTQNYYLRMAAEERDKLKAQEIANQEIKVEPQIIEYSELEKSSAKTIYDFLQGLSDLTELQKDDYIDKAKATVFSDTGTVESVSEVTHIYNEDAQAVVKIVSDYKLNSDYYRYSNFTVTFNFPKTSALKLNKGDRVKFTGKLNDFTSFVPSSGTFDFYDVLIEPEIIQQEQPLLQPNVIVPTESEE